MKTALVTGISGQDGAYLAKLLTKGRKPRIAKYTLGNQGPVPCSSAE